MEVWTSAWRSWMDEVKVREWYGEGQRGFVRTCRPLEGGAPYPRRTGRARGSVERRMWDVNRRTWNVERRA